MRRSFRLAVRNSLKTLDLGVRDEAIEKLAYRYAQLLDAGRDPHKYGPLLLQALEALLLTPRSRQRIMKGIGTDERPQESSNPLDEIATRRAARKAGN